MRNENIETIRAALRQMVNFARTAELDGMLAECMGSQCKRALAALEQIEWDTAVHASAKNLYAALELLTHDLGDTLAYSATAHQREVYRIACSALAKARGESADIDAAMQPVVNPKSENT